MNIKKMLVPVLIFAAFLTLSVSAYAANDTYVVQKGDSLWKIAQKYKVGISEIISANPSLRNPNLIYPGDTITIPLENPQTLSVEEEVVRLTNQERAKQGLKPLTLNWQVARVARYKSTDMRDNKYFSHNSPSYGSPFDMLKKFNISYSSAAENIAKGQKTAQAVVSSWMNSEGHRKNILNPSFTEIGIGYVDGSGGPFWTQIFIRP